eukprot:scaffold36741_cov63-Cyclotella_meneghiniana.AAC.1
MALGICSPNERLTLIKLRLLTGSLGLCGLWLVALPIANRTWTMAWKLGAQIALRWGSDGAQNAPKS